jgi:hypothetical protein
MHICTAQITVGTLGLQVHELCLFIYSLFMLSHLLVSLPDILFWVSQVSPTGHLIVLISIYHITCSLLCAEFLEGRAHDLQNFHIIKS